MFYNRRALLLVSALGLASLSAFSAHADEKGDRILREAFQKLHAARSFTADLVSEIKQTGQPAVSSKGHIQARKPNRLRVEITMPGSQTAKQQYLSNGKSYYSYYGGNTFYRQKVDANPTGFTGNWEGEVDAFFGGVKNAAQLTADYAGTERVDGILCDLVKARTKSSGDARAFTYAIGQKDRLIHRTINRQSAQLTMTNSLHNIRLDTTIAESQFAFNPPNGAKEYDADAEMRKMEAKLVPVGQEAPAFEATDPVTQSRFSLVQALDKKKVLLVNFWFYG